MDSGLAMEVVDGEFGKRAVHEELHVDEGWLYDEAEFRLKIGARFSSLRFPLS